MCVGCFWVRKRYSLSSKSKGPTPSSLSGCLIRRPRWGQRGTLLVSGEEGDAGWHALSYNAGRVRGISALHQLSPFTSLWGKCHKYPHCTRQLRLGETKSKVKWLEGRELGFRIRIYACLNLKLSLAITHWKMVPGNPEKFRCDHLSLRKKAGEMAESQQKVRLLLVC